MQEQAYGRLQFALGNTKWNEDYVPNYFNVKVVYVKAGNQEKKKWYAVRNKGGNKKEKKRKVRNKKKKKKSSTVDPQWICERSTVDQ
jgi:hypothetical protein